MIATHIKTNGSQEVVTPLDGQELQAFVGGLVQLVEFPDGTEIWVNEEGKLFNLPVNHKATAMWADAFRGYDFGADDIIVGDVLIIRK